MYSPRTDSTVSVSSSSGMSADAGGRIEKVLVLNGDANSALGALLSNLEALDSTLIEMGVASNQRETLMDIRKAAYGY